MLEWLRISQPLERCLPDRQSRPLLPRPHHHSYAGPELRDAGGLSLYGKYLELRAERRARRIKEYEEQQEYIARQEEFIRKYGAANAIARRVVGRRNWTDSNSSVRRTTRR